MIIKLINACIINLLFLSRVVATYVRMYYLHAAYIYIILRQFSLAPPQSRQA